ncbi:MAG: 23S rRNA (uracil(1939)-C(5))-methyltransferase RlmD [Acidobacteria bacterium]|nr:MAG: 23S rRNA (uracil(1939)-C(5))-methyltransferase RlmD [Acidobacteriota bacterium]
MPNVEIKAGSCSQSRECTGCPLIHLDYEAQLKLKEEQVRSFLEPHLQRASILPVQPADPPLGYRATAKLSVRTIGEKVIVGLFRTGSHEVIDTTDCPAHHPLVNGVAMAIKEELQRIVRRGEPFKKSATRLRHAVIRVSPAFGKSMVTFVLREDDDRLVKTLSKGVNRRVPAVVSVHKNLNTGPTSQVFGPETKLVWGYPDLLDRIGPDRILLSPVSFFQAHHGQAAWIYALVRRWAELKPSDSALDLYCGVGGITMSLARDAGMALGVEASAEAVRDAKRNAGLNSLENCRFRVADAAHLGKVLGKREMPAVVTLNPPRSGAAVEVLKQAAQLEPRSIIYVSCSPETLARDLQVLARIGFRAAQVQPVDMFPQTPHVETVVQLRRN